MAEGENLPQTNNAELSTEQLLALTKKELVALVQGTLTNQDAKLDNLFTVLTEMRTEINGKLTQLDTIQNAINDMGVRVGAAESNITRHETSISTLKQDVERIDTTVNNNFPDVYRSMEYMQRFCEGIDSKLRGRNIIMLGVSESDTTHGSDDLERAKHIIEKTGAIAGETIGELGVKRLGTSQMSGRSRPLHVELENHDKQWKVLQNSKNLKDLTGYQNIYIKKDMHPTIRNEFNRLRRREKEERENPANTGINIEYDWRARVLKRNHVVIDRFNPSFQ